MTIKCPRSLAPIIVIAAATLPAHADVELLTQERTANMRWYDPQEVPHQQDWGATDFAPASIVFEPDGPAVARGYASHTSSLSSALITTSMHTEGTHFIQVTDGWGRSELTVTFRVNAPTPFQLVGDWEALGTGETLIELTGPGVSITYFEPAYGMSGSDTFDDSGLLSVGDYYLHARMSATGSRGTIAAGEATINLALHIPTPGALSLAGLALLGSARRRRA